MSRHVTYRGVTMDMDAMRRENEKVPAIGNMKVNARGDRIAGGKVTKSAEEIARENHRVQSAIVNTGLKGAMPASPEAIPEQKPTKAKAPIKQKEIQMPNGDIVMGDDNGN